MIAVVVRGETVYAGCQDGHLKVWDLETRTLVRVLITSEVRSLSFIPCADCPRVINWLTAGSSLLTAECRHPLSEHAQVRSLRLPGEWRSAGMSPRFHWRVRSDDGRCRQRWSSQFEQTAAWPAHEGIVLTSIVTRISATPSRAAADVEGLVLDTGNEHLQIRDHGNVKFALVTGANDDQMKVRFLRLNRLQPSTNCIRRSGKSSRRSRGRARTSRCLRTPTWSGATLGTVRASLRECPTDSLTGRAETMVYALSKFVSIPSVSNAPAHREDCRQAAIWLRKCFTQLGAEACLVRPISPVRRR